MKILITGSNGFIGSNLVRKLLYLDKTIKIVGIDNLSNPQAKRNTYVNGRYAFYLGSVVDKSFTSKVLEIEKPDILIHLAYDLYNEFKVKLLGLNNFNTYRFKKVFLIHDNKNAISNSLSDFMSEYSSIKEYNSGGLNHTFTITVDKIFGPRQFNGNLIPDLINKLNKKESITLECNDYIYNWVYINDVCKMIYHLIKGDLDLRNIDDSGGGWFSLHTLDGWEIPQISNPALSEKIASYLEEDPKLITWLDKKISILDDVREKPGFPIFQNERKDEKIFFTPFTEALNATIDWYLTNEWFSKPT